MGTEVNRPQVIPHFLEHGVVHLSSIFLHDRLSQVVMVGDDSSPIGYGTRPLSRLELGDLWEIPILLKDLIAINTAFADSVAALLCSPLARILFLGEYSLVFSWL